MADLTTNSALDALNEKDYINKLYDTNSKNQQELIKEHFEDNTGVLNQEQDRTRQQSQEQVNRTQVEAAQQQYTGPKVSAGARQQMALNRGNTLQGNVNDLQQKRSAADQEIERQRQLLASYFETEIRKAQADNDMLRAQQLYQAAKDEEAKLLALRQDAATLMSERGDNSIRDSLLKGEAPAADYSGETWDQVLKDEAAVNDIYDKQLKSERLAVQMRREEALSDLEAKRQKQQEESDRKLTDAYVNALQKQKNYAEVQGAYGQGSGTAAAARMAQDAELLETLTGIRGAQAEADAQYGMEGFDLEKAYREELAGKEAETGRQRAEALIKAAEENETNLYNTQLRIGQEMANQGDYSVLAKLYGLTPDQIDRLMNRGIYAQSGDYDDSPSPGKSSSNRDVLANPRNDPDEWEMLLAMKNNK